LIRANRPRHAARSDGQRCLRIWPDTSTTAHVSGRATRSCRWRGRIDLRGIRHRTRGPATAGLAGVHETAGRSLRQEEAVVADRRPLMNWDRARWDRADV